MELPWLAFVWCSTAILASHSLALSSEKAALALADNTEDAETVVTPYTTFAELGLLSHDYPNDGDAGSFVSERFSYDLRASWNITQSAQFIFSDRIDILDDQDRRGTSDDNPRAINAIREAFVSWHLTPITVVDVGRVNIRNGIAIGYNPTDYFKTNSLKSVSSLSPESLRENRLGTFGFHGQLFSARGSIALLAAPKLSDKQSTGVFNPNLEMTNSETRMLLTGSYHISDSVAPQILLYSVDGEPVQAGLNLSYLIGGATVTYIEYSGGKACSLFDQATTTDCKTIYRSQLTAGITYTTTSNLSVSFEYIYDGRALTQEEWSALRRQPSTPLVEYLQESQIKQAPFSKRQWFMIAKWDNFIVNELDLSAFVRRSEADGSSALWAEFKYHFSKTDVAFQMQHKIGGERSEYGLQPPSSEIQLALRHYF